MWFTTMSPSRQQLCFAFRKFFEAELTKTLHFVIYAPENKFCRIFHWRTGASSSREKGEYLPWNQLILFTLISLSQSLQSFAEFECNKFSMNTRTTECKLQSKTFLNCSFPLWESWRSKSGILFGFRRWDERSLSIALSEQTWKLVVSLSLLWHRLFIGVPQL